MTNMLLFWLGVGITAMIGGFAFLFYFLPYLVKLAVIAQ